MVQETEQQLIDSTIKSIENQSEFKSYGNYLYLAVGQVAYLIYKAEGLDKVFIKLYREIIDTLNDLHLNLLSVDEIQSFDQRMLQALGRVIKARKNVMTHIQRLGKDENDFSYYSAVKSLLDQEKFTWTSDMMPELLEIMKTQLVTPDLPTVQHQESLNAKTIYDYTQNNIGVVAPYSFPQYDTLKMDARFSKKSTYQEGLDDLAKRQYITKHQKFDFKSNQTILLNNETPTAQSVPITGPVMSDAQLHQLEQQVNDQISILNDEQAAKDWKDTSANDNLGYVMPDISQPDQTPQTIHSDGTVEQNITDEEIFGK